MSTATATVATGTTTTDTVSSSCIVPVWVLYCAKCGMPPEYCEYGPDFERACDPWLKKTHPEVHSKLKALRIQDGTGTTTTTTTTTIDETDKSKAENRPDAPWTTEERLRKFYELYVPEKVSDVPSLLEKYAGKEDKLFLALVKKYGPEPDDPYYMDSADDDDNDDDDSDDGHDDELKEGMDNLHVDGKKRRGVKAKKAIKFETKVVIQTQKVKKKKAMTIIHGMETVEGIKLKDVAKAFSKRFAGSSSVKDGPKGKEIIIQGDHKEDVATMIVNEFKVPGSAVFLDFDGDVVAYS
ncbi:translation initiation factor SUI1 [Nitzschia inconspicua]|uniref:Translation initiation factor SUI1 n=1 Tax=Nitzschia inconspicua TaxID=303405 RepID=A0A9K3KLS0_9STRA|nr:translation initiation factor SUI1 [Nitzschia inconspicua]